MKKIFILALLCAMVSSLKAQYTAEVVTNAGNPQNDVWVYVGSLRPSDGGNYEKLKIEVFGGHWVNANGETTYYVSNRDVMSVNQVTMGSTNDNQFTLRAFDNNGGLDFYIYTPGNSFAAYTVKSCLLGGGGAQYNVSGAGSSTSLVPVTVQAIAPPGMPSAGAEQTLTIVPVMITDASGNIGINTPNPDASYKLSVNGSIRAKEVKVETGWADYVFEQGYTLKPLNAVADYINKNHHLPGVPTAAEVERNGVKVGETEALLLKKIEELTLYLIERDKQLSSQNERIKKLEKQIKPHRK